VTLATAEWESTTSFVTGLKYVQVSDWAVCSHLLFTISMEWWLKQSTNTTNLVRDVGLKHTEHSRLRDLCFADDASLIDDTVGGSQIMTDSVAYSAEKLGVCVNVDATAWTAVGIGASYENGTGQLMVNSKQVELVDEFCYLGSILTSSGNCRKEIHARIAKADSAFNKLNSIWRGRKLGLPIKIRFYNYSIAKAVLLYSTET